MRTRPICCATSTKWACAVQSDDLSVQRATTTTDVPAHRPETIILVHCAWAGGWIWRDIVPRLREMGHTVYAPTLTGMGELAHLARPEIDLDTHVSDVTDLLAHEDLHDVHLVGWSYGGLVISGVAEVVPERLAQLIYLDATVATHGQSGNDAERATAEEVAELEASGLTAGLPGFFTCEPAAGVARCKHAEPRGSRLGPGQLHAATNGDLRPTAVPANPASTRIGRTHTSSARGERRCDVRPLDVDAGTPLHGSRWRVVQVEDTHMAPVNNPEAIAKLLEDLAQ